MSYIYNGVNVSVEDMSRKFRNSYIVLKEVGLVYVIGFTEENCQVIREKETLILSPKNFIVEQEYPDVGIVVNYRKCCGLISRIPRRQWAAGLIPETLSVINEAGFRFMPDSGKLSFSMAKALFFPDYPHIDKVFSAVKNDPTISLAFSKFYWLCNPTKEEVILYRRNIELGVLNKIKDTYILNLLDYSCSLQQELKDELKDVKFTINQSI